MSPFDGACPEFIEGLRTGTLRATKNCALVEPCLASCVTSISPPLSSNSGHSVPYVSKNIIAPIELINSTKFGNVTFMASAVVTVVTPSAARPATARLITTL